MEQKSLSPIKSLAFLVFLAPGLFHIIASFTFHVVSCYVTHLSWLIIITRRHSLLTASFVADSEAMHVGQGILPFTFYTIIWDTGQPALSDHSPKWQR